MNDVFSKTFSLLLFFFFATFLSCKSKHCSVKKTLKMGESQTHSGTEIGGRPASWVICQHLFYPEIEYLCLSLVVYVLQNIIIWGKFWFSCITRLWSYFKGRSLPNKSIVPSAFSVCFGGIFIFYHIGKIIPIHFGTSWE
jgi:hypothetical protein